MKKIKLLIILFIGINVYSQDRTVNRIYKIHNYKILNDNYLHYDNIKTEITYHKYTGVILDTITESQDSLSIQVLVYSSYPYKFELFTDIVKLSDNSDYIVQYQAKVFEGEAWKDIDRINHFEKSYYRHLRVLLINISGKSRLKSFEIKIWI